MALTLSQPADVVDFALPAHGGGVVRLLDESHAGPTVLAFYRGHWCPYCRRYLGKLRDHFHRFTERGARLLAISPEPVATGSNLARELSLPFTLLSDTDGSVIDAWGTRATLGRVNTLLPHPAVFITDAAGRLRFRSIDRNFKKRTTVRTIIGVLDEIAAGDPPPTAMPTAPPPADAGGDGSYHPA